MFADNNKMFGIDQVHTERQRHKTLYPVGMKGLSHCFIKLQASKLTVSVTTRPVLDVFNIGPLTIWKATLYVTTNSYMTDNSSTFVHGRV